MESDILIKFEVRDNMGETFRQYAFLTAPSARSGNHKEDQVFVCLQPVDWDFDIHQASETSSAGLILEIQSLPFIQPPIYCRFPPQPEMSGRLRMFTGDQFAAFLLDLPIGVDSQRDPVEVTASLMNFKDILPSRIVITGVDDNITGIIANAEYSPLSNPDQNDADDGSDSGQEDGDTQGQDNLGFDLLCMLEEQCGDEGTLGSRPKRPRKTKTKTSSKSEPAPDTSDKGCGDPLLDDPCLRTFLSADDIEALRLARSQCENQQDIGLQDMFGDFFAPSFDVGESDGEEIEHIEGTECMEGKINLEGDHTVASSSASDGPNHLVDPWFAGLDV